VLPAEAAAGRPRSARRRRRAIWGAVAVAALALIVVLAVALTGSANVKLVSFVGKTKAQAAATASHLRVIPQFRQHASDAPGGTVFRQIPKAGTEVPTGTTVILLVSGGSGAVTTPPLTTPPPAPSEDHGGNGEQGHHGDHGKGKGKD
jgi:hypothetical protein